MFVTCPMKAMVREALGSASQVHFAKPVCPCFSSSSLAFRGRKWVQAPPRPHVKPMLTTGNNYQKLEAGKHGPPPELPQTQSVRAALHG